MLENEKESMKILTYKSKIDNMLKFAQSVNIDRTKEGLKSILRAELEKNQITQYEYDELVKYIDKFKIEVKLENNIEQNKIKEKDNNTLKQEKKQLDRKIDNFKDRIKFKVEGLPILDTIIMYKGQIGQVAPKNEKNDQKEIDK